MKMIFRCSSALCFSSSLSISTKSLQPSLIQTLFSSAFHLSSSDLSQAFISFLISPLLPAFDPFPLTLISSYNSFPPLLSFFHPQFIIHSSCETNLTLPFPILIPVSSPPGALFGGGGRPGVPPAPSGGDGEAAHVR